MREYSIFSSHQHFRVQFAAFVLNWPLVCMWSLWSIWIHIHISTSSDAIQRALNLLYGYIENRQLQTIFVVVFRLKNCSHNLFFTICLINLFRYAHMLCSVFGESRFRSEFARFSAYEKCSYLIFELCIYPWQIINQMFKCVCVV